MGVSAVILTHNDFETISECLDTVEWCDEIVVVDSYSNDGTEEIIANRADTVAELDPAREGEPFDHFRAKGFEAASNQWIVSIDADERIPTSLAHRLGQLAGSNCADVFWTPRKNLFKNRWLDSGYWWPAYTPRLMDSSNVNITKEVHNFYYFDENTNHLRLPPDEEFAVIHQKAESYQEALQTARRHAKIRSRQEQFKFKKLGAFPYTFWRFYIDTQSYRDGIPGLLLSLIHSWYRTETVIRSIFQ